MRLRKFSSGQYAKKVVAFLDKGNYVRFTSVNDRETNDPREEADARAYADILYFEKDFIDSDEPGYVVLSDGVGLAGFVSFSEEGGPFWITNHWYIGPMFLSRELNVFAAARGIEKWIEARIRKAYKGKAPLSVTLSVHESMTDIIAFWESLGYIQEPRERYYADVCLREEGDLSAMWADERQNIITMKKML